MYVSHVQNSEHSTAAVVIPHERSALPENIARINTVN